MECESGCAQQAGGSLGGASSLVHRAVLCSGGLPPPGTIAARLRHARTAVSLDRPTLRVVAAARRLVRERGARRGASSHRIDLALVVAPAALLAPPAECTFGGCDAAKISARAEEPEGALLSRRVLMWRWMLHALVRGSFAMPRV